MSVSAPSQVMYTAEDIERSGWISPAQAPINHQDAAILPKPGDVGLPRPQSNDSTTIRKPTRSDSSDSGLLGCSSQSTTMPNVLPPTIPTPTEPIDAVWQRYVAVPGCRKGNKIFLKAPVKYGPWSQDLCCERFHFVKDKLKYLVEQHFKLHGLERCPAYISRMTGLCPLTARPSIVVICQAQDLKGLQKLFRSKAEKQLLISDDKSFRQQVQRLFGPQPDATSVIPRLKIVYCMISGSTVIRTASGEPVNAYIGDGDVCGGLVRSHKKFATLGVTIGIDNLKATLTVYHLFKTDAERPETLACLQTDPSGPSVDTFASLSESGSDIACDFWSDDDEYDVEGFMNSGLNDSQPIPADLDHLKTIPDVPELWERVIPPRKPQHDETFLDWALVRPSPANPKKLHQDNKLAGFKDTKTSLELCEIRREPPRHLSPVVMVSGVRGIIRGQILAQTGFIPSYPTRGYFEAWNVILNDDLALVSGESGSIILDEATHEVYGHVVGCDSLGHVYVVPLTDVLEQIKTCFGASHIRLTSQAERRANQSLEATQDPSDDTVGDSKESLLIGDDDFTTMFCPPGASSNTSLPVEMFGTNNLKQRNRLNDKETRFLLSEMIKQSKVDIDDLVGFIRTHDVVPEWLAMQLPAGQTLDDCFMAADALLGPETTDNTNKAYLSAFKASSLDPGIIPIAWSTKEQMKEDVLENVRAWIVSASQAPAEAPAGDTDGATNTGGSNTHAGFFPRDRDSPGGPRGSQGAKRGPPENDDNDLGSRGGHEKRPRKDIQAAKPPLLACPFPKKYPNRTWTRCMQGWSSVSRLKSHIYINHKYPIHCDRCHSIFKTEKDRAIHFRSETQCVINENPEPLIGISPDMEKRIRSRKGIQNVPDEDLWVRLWSIIFPEDHQIPSPYCDLSIIEDPTQYREFLRQVLPIHLVREVLLELNSASMLPMEARSIPAATLRGVVQKAVSDAFEKLIPEATQTPESLSFKANQSSQAVEATPTSGNTTTREINAITSEDMELIDDGFLPDIQWGDVQGPGPLQAYNTDGKGKGKGKGKGESE